jgi:hypothetical protein
MTTCFSRRFTYVTGATLLTFVLVVTYQLIQTL